MSLIFPLKALHRFNGGSEVAPPPVGASNSPSVLWGDGAFSTATSSTSLQFGLVMVVSRVISVEPWEFVELIEQAPGSAGTYQGALHPHYEFRTDPYGRGGRGSGRSRGRDDADAPMFAYEEEDQSGSPALRPGSRVRHAQFGVGTIVSVEPLDDDARVVVRFSIGQKTLRARYAKLERA